MARRGPKVKQSNPLRMKVTEPTPPAWLGEQALAKWREIIPLLQELGTIGAIDLSVLARYCAMWSQWVDCQAVIQTGGMTYQLILEGQGTIIKERPEVRIAKQLQDAIFRIENAIGMNATSRHSLALQEPTKELENPFEAVRIACGLNADGSSPERTPPV